MIEERRKHPRDDLLSLFVHDEDQGQVLENEQIVATSALILTAGYETTAYLIGNGLLALLEHPDQLQKLRGNPDL
jgi:cytochrome P450